MSAHPPAHDAAHNGGRPWRTRTACSAAASAAGLTGSLACAAAMVLAGLGSGAATAAAGMDGAGNPPRGLLGLLLRVGPWLLAASVVLVAGAFALRRPAATVPALLAGALLYAGMYAQSSRTVMYLSIAVGYTGWAVLYVWVRQHRQHHSDRAQGAPPVRPSG